MNRCRYFLSPNSSLTHSLSSLLNPISKPFACPSFSFHSLFRLVNPRSLAHSIPPFTPIHLFADPTPDNFFFLPQKTISALKTPFFRRFRINYTCTYTHTFFHIHKFIDWKISLLIRNYTSIIIMWKSRFE